MPKIKGKTLSNPSIEETSKNITSSMYHEPETKSQDSISHTKCGQLWGVFNESRSKKWNFAGEIELNKHKRYHTNLCMDTFDASTVVTAEPELKGSKIEDTTESIKMHPQGGEVVQEIHIEPTKPNEPISHTTWLSAIDNSHKDNENKNSPTKAALSLTEPIVAVKIDDVCAQNGTKMA